MIIDLQENNINIKQKRGWHMNKKIVCIISLSLILLAVPFCAADDETSAKTGLDTVTVYYPNATLNSIISKYKVGNYTGCLQESFSYVKKHPNDSAAYYYMALAYTKAGDTASAISAYDKAIEKNSSSTVVDNAIRGKACLTGDDAICHPQAGNSDEELTDLDKFINAPYGNGLSPELNEEIRQKELKRMQQEINNNSYKPYKSEAKGSVTGAAANISEEEISEIPSNKEILDAIDTLKRAGLQINVSDISKKNDIQNVMSDPEISARNAEYAQLNMLLGNNNSNNNSMMQMLPYLMNQDGTPNKNLNPRVIESMMTSSMLDSFNSYNNNNSNNY